MVRRLTAAAAFVLVSVTPLAAELKVTMKTTVREAAAGAPADPILALIGGLVTGELRKLDGVETVSWIGDGVIRTDLNRELLGSAPVTIQFVDGSVIGIHPADKTFYRTSLAADLAAVEAAGVRPQVTVKRTGEVARLLDLRAERVLMDVRVPIPLPPEMAGALPPGFPSSFDLALEAWVTDAFPKYSQAMTRGNPLLAQFGLRGLDVEGVTLRQIMRSPLFGGLEMDMAVVAIGEERAPEGHFAVPAGYREVPPPGIR